MSFLAEHFLRYQIHLLNINKAKISIKIVLCLMVLMRCKSAKTSVLSGVNIE